MLIGKVVGSAVKRETAGAALALLDLEDDGNCGHQYDSDGDYDDDDYYPNYEVEVKHYSVNDVEIHPDMTGLLADLHIDIFCDGVSCEPCSEMLDYGGT